MKQFKFTFEEIFKNGASRRHSITIDLSIKKNWEAICNYDSGDLIQFERVGFAKLEVVSGVQNAYFSHP